MPTSVHIPKPLLEQVDRRARALKISRNKFIVRALEHEIENPTNWSEGFFERLGEADDDLGSEVDRMLETIKGSRSSKGPVAL